MKKPTNYDELYPGRFLKAGLFKGKKPTLTITDVDLEEMEDEERRKKAKAILTFSETKLQLLACKTNGYCIKTMFGAELKDWLGKRITFFESQWNGEPCIRVWGSPDIKQDMQIEVRLPRRSPIRMTMHSVKGVKPAAAVEPEPEVETADLEVLSA